MNNFNFYKIYGLKVKSEIEIHPSLLIYNDLQNYDVEILISKDVKSNTEDSKTYHIGNFSFSDNSAGFFIDNVGYYEITNGNRIVINPYRNSDTEEVKKFTLGSALGLLLFQRNIVAIHGGAISINENGVIISGSIGAGKTTTVASLINKGHKFLSDDVSAVTQRFDGEYYINSCIPHQKLCKSTVEMLGYDTNNLFLIDKTKNKYYSPEISNFTTEPSKLKALFYLTITNDDEVSYEKIEGAEKLKIILSNIFRKEYIPNELFKSMFIKECLNLSKNISIYKIKRPKDKNSLAQVVSII